MLKRAGFVGRQTIARRAFGPGDLFAGGAQGAWYDPSDRSTLFQDAAGTTPVTAVEQPVRLMNDKSGRGNHATAPNDASRPVLRARYNLLAFSEQFDNAFWIKTSQGAGIAPVVTADAGVAPDGTMTADRVQFARSNTATTDRSRLERVSIPALASTDYVFSVWIKRTGSVNQTVTLYANFGNGMPISVIATSEWQRFSVSANTLTGTIAPVVMGLGYVSNSILEADVLIWGAQILSAADQAATGGAYQRVAAATDYDTSNPVWRPYLAFDGSDDSFSTSSIDFSGTDEVTVFAGVTKLSDAARGTVAELSIGAANGSWSFEAPPAASDTFQVRSVGTSSLTATASGLPAPITRVATGQFDISADICQLRLNGVQVAQNTGDQGTGNFGNYPLFIGRRNNTSNPFNGRLTSLIVLGRTATAVEISATEAWVNGKTGAF